MPPPYPLQNALHSSHPAGTPSPRLKPARFPNAGILRFFTMSFVRAFSDVVDRARALALLDASIHIYLDAFDYRRRAPQNRNVRVLGPLSYYGSIYVCVFATMLWVARLWTTCIFLDAGKATLAMTYIGAIIGCIIRVRRSCTGSRAWPLHLMT